MKSIYLYILLIILINLKASDTLNCYLTNTKPCQNIKDDKKGAFECFKNLKQDEKSCALDENYCGVIVHQFVEGDTVVFTDCDSENVRACTKYTSDDIIKALEFFAERKLFNHTCGQCDTKDLCNTKDWFSKKNAPKLANTEGKNTTAPPKTANNKCYRVLPNIAIFILIVKTSISF